MISPIKRLNIFRHLRHGHSGVKIECFVHVSV